MSSLNRFHTLRTTALSASLLMAMLLPGCALFVSHYDAGAYQQFTALKAFHMKFLEDFKAAESRTFSEVMANEACDTGDLKFREAREYASGKKDETRVRAVEYLSNVFIRNCRLLLREKKLFGATYSTEQTAELEKNYDLAIAGEVARVGAPSN